MPNATFALATHLDAKTLAPALLRVVQSEDKNLPLLDIRTQNDPAERAAGVDPIQALRHE